ncbi:hypothetical protein BJ944DRAFT_266345 [Cunninghamella echinulata]|nr:hypothetical protein BJ944DRAFT_266345 [Cunninghamella echinulata]
MAFRLLNHSLRLQSKVKSIPVYASKCLYTTTQPSTTKITENVTKKFIAQAKKGHDNSKRFGIPSKLVTIDGLPITATAEDIKKMVREAITDGDKYMREAVFCRNFEFRFNGRCVVMMDSIDNARKLIEYGNFRMIGGNSISMKFTKTDTRDLNEFMNKQRRRELISVTDATSAAGRSVIFTGLPPKTRTDQLLGILRSKNLFPREGTSNTVIPLRTKEQSTVAKFLIKFDNESEAWRCVRSFHNTIFTLKKFKTDYRLSVSVAY